MSHVQWDHDKDEALLVAAGRRSRFDVSSLRALCHADSPLHGELSTVSTAIATAVATARLQYLRALRQGAPLEFATTDLAGAQHTTARKRHLIRRSLPAGRPRVCPERFRVGEPDRAAVALVCDSARTEDAEWLYITTSRPLHVHTVCSAIARLVGACIRSFTVDLQVAACHTQSKRLAFGRLLHFRYHLQTLRWQELLAAAG